MNILALEYSSKNNAVIINYPCICATFYNTIMKVGNYRNFPEKYMKFSGEFPGLTTLVDAANIAE